MNFGYRIRARNVNTALPTALELLRMHGVSAESRGMRTLRLPGPVTTIYTRPTERVLFDPVRDANPFFHLFESLWILGGSCRVELPKTFLNSIDRFSDNGVTFHGAYGYRLRSAFGFDQISRAIDLLNEDDKTRQVVLSIWHPAMDLGTKTKDVPCNDMIMLDIVDGRLNMTVCNRSNDAIWGAYGANVVQFSMLQEYIAASLEIPVGMYTQQSNNFHVYLDNPYWRQHSGPAHILPEDPYSGSSFMLARPIARNAMDALLLRRDCEYLCEQAENAGLSNNTTEFKSSFGQETIVSALQGYLLYKQGDYLEAVRTLEHIAAPDWRQAMIAWVIRRAEKKVAA